MTEAADINLTASHLKLCPFNLKLSQRRLKHPSKALTLLLKPALLHHQICIKTPYTAPHEVDSKKSHSYITLLTTHQAGVFLCQQSVLIAHQQI